jgi:hypothetical protein
VLICRVVDTKRVDAKRRASGGAEQVVADVKHQAHSHTVIYILLQFTIDPLSGAASVIAVVSLAIQIAESAKSIKQFLGSISKDHPCSLLLALTPCCLPGTAQDLISLSMSVDVFAVESLSSRAPLPHAHDVALALQNGNAVCLHRVKLHLAIQPISSSSES